ncbi:MAG: phage tail tape measure protein [candidate division WOR-3 bacterium]
MAKIGELVVELKLIREKFSQELRRATDDIGQFKRSFSALSNVAAVVGTAVVGALSKMTYDFVRYGSEIDRLSKITGIATDSIQKLVYAAQQEHTSVEGLAVGLRNLSRTMVEAQQGTKEYVEFFKLVGIDFQSAADRSITLEEALLRISDAFVKIPDGAEKTAIAIKLFGRSGSELVPFLSVGRERLQALGEEFVKTGKLLSPDAVKRAKELNDQFNQLKTTIQGVALQTAETLVPVIQDLVHNLQSLLERYNKLPVGIRRTGTEALLLAGALAILVKTITIIINGIKTLQSVILPLITVFSSFAGAISGVAAALGAGGLAIRHFVRDLRTAQVLEQGVQVGLAVKQGQRVSWLDKRLLEARLYEIAGGGFTTPEIERAKKRFDEIRNLQEWYKRGLPVIEATAETTEDLASKIAKIGEKSGEAKEKVKTLFDIFTEKTADLADINKVLQDAANILGIQLTTAALQNRDMVIQLSGVYDGLLASVEENIESQKLVADFFARVLPQGVEVAIKDLDKYKRALYETGAVARITEPMLRVALAIEKVKDVQVGNIEVLRELNDLFGEQVKEVDLVSEGVEGLSDTLLALAGAYEILSERQRENFELQKSFAGTLKLIQAGYDFDKEELLKFYETANKLGYDAVNIGGEWVNIEEKIAELMDELTEKTEKLTKEQQLAVNLFAEFASTLMDAMIAGRSFGEEMNRVFERLIQTIIRAIIKALILKAIKGSAMGWGDVFDVVFSGIAAGFDAPRSDMRLMVQSYYSTLRNAYQIAERWTNDFNRYRNLGISQLVGVKEKPVFYVDVSAPLPGAYVKAVQQLPAGEMDLFYQKVQKRVIDRRKIL